MPRVALLVNFIPPYRLPILEALAAEVDELRVFVSTPVEPNRPWTADWGSLNVTVQRTLTFRKQWKKAGSFKEGVFVHVPLDTLNQLWRYEPDVVISGELGARTALAAVYRRLRPASRLIVWATVSQITERERGRLRLWVRPPLASHADAVVVNGGSGGRYMQSLGVPPERIVVAHQTVDVSAFAAVPPVAPVPSRHRLLYAGMLVERKGLVRLLEELATWGRAHAESAAEFKIVGDGPERNRLEAVPMPANVRVEFVPAVPYATLPGLYADSDIFVLPTIEDEWGVVVNEAMAAGRPVLGSVYSQAVEELVQDQVTGWTFRPDHPAEVASAVSRALATSPDDLRRMGAAASTRAARLAPATIAHTIADTVRWVSAQ